MPKLLKLIYSYTVRHFTTVSKTKNFLELDFSFVHKVLSDSSLNVTSELEVLKAADAWFTYMSKERMNFGRRLFLQVRYPLFSLPALEKVLGASLFFQTTKEGTLLKQEILQDKEGFYESKPVEYFTSRHCDQDMFDLLVLGGNAPNREKDVWTA